MDGQENGIQDNVGVEWAGGRVQLLPTLGRAYSEPVFIGSDGVGCGRSETSARGLEQACVWKSGQGINLIEDGGAFPGGSFAASESKGTVAGAWNGACCWEGGRLRSLPNFGGPDSAAASINNQGIIVGRADRLERPSEQGMRNEGYNDDRACQWRDGEIYDLNAFIPAHSGWILQECSRINDAGEIIGIGWKQGEERGFLLIPHGSR